MMPIIHQLHCWIHDTLHQHVRVGHAEHHVDVMKGCAFGDTSEELVREGRVLKHITIRFEAAVQVVDLDCLQPP